jgi:hypothetical protein
MLSIAEVADSGQIGALKELARKSHYGLYVKFPEVFGQSRRNIQGSMRNEPTIGGREDWPDGVPAAKSFVGQEWLDEQFGWSERTARNYIKVAEAFPSLKIRDGAGHITITGDATHLLRNRYAIILVCPVCAWGRPYPTERARPTRRRHHSTCCSGR